MANNENKKKGISISVMTYTGVTTKGDQYPLFVIGPVSFRFGFTSRGNSSASCYAATAYENDEYAIKRINKALNVVFNPEEPLRIDFAFWKANNNSNGKQPGDRLEALVQRANSKISEAKAKNADSPYSHMRFIITGRGSIGENPNNGSRYLSIQVYDYTTVLNVQSECYSPQEQQNAGGQGYSPQQGQYAPPQPGQQYVTSQGYQQQPQQGQQYTPPQGYQQPQQGYAPQQGQYAPPQQGQQYAPPQGYQQPQQGQKYAPPQQGQYTPPQGHQQPQQGQKYAPPQQGQYTPPQGYQQPQQGQYAPPQQGQQYAPPQGYQQQPQQGMPQYMGSDFSELNIDDADLPF